jgi:8-oxo-dGTP diphosphatase
MTVPQFGEPETGLVYRDRPAAFGVLVRGGAIALVTVRKPDHAPWIDLPGGAVDPGETLEAALVREFGEETGLGVSAGDRLGRADQYFVKTDGEPVNNRQTFFETRFLEPAPRLKIETDHELVWVDPARALKQLRHPSHAWAVVLALRKGLIAI